jgi:hypothetical protein
MLRPKSAACFPARPYFVGPGNIFFILKAFHVAAKFLCTEHHIREVPGSIFRPKTEYTEVHLRGISQTLQESGNSNLATAVFFPIHCSAIIYR